MTEPKLINYPICVHCGRVILNEFEHSDCSHHVKNEHPSIESVNEVSEFLKKSANYMQEVEGSRHFTGLTQLQSLLKLKIEDPDAMFDYKYFYDTITNTINHGYKLVKE